MKGLRANIDLVDFMILLGFIWLMIGIWLLAGWAWALLVGGIILMAGGMWLAVRRSK
jgi:hypothetical protein